ncbi:YceI family protein [Fulvivirga sediminis]|uniref:YceI family protein n=1 Tax=Fulvivirga sediminis TaxID=2803949 RepID=A0A937FBG1_9BACT|nr:YceI family protein [Fulvivirga sediminis]MBL3658109.1 YceI family protein [Fulvivirga sediminis]
MKKILFSLLAVITAATGVSAQTNWDLDKAHTKIGFSVSHMTISEVEGSFQEFDGSVVSSSDDFDGAEISFTAKTASIDTDVEQRNEHLKSADFFNVAKYPELTFKGKLKKSGKKYKLEGDFTLLGVTKPVTFDVKYNGTIVDPYGNTKAGFQITGTIDRTEYGMTWNSTLDAGGLLVGEDVEITANVELQKKA